MPQLTLALNHETISLHSPGLTGLLVGGVEVGEGPRELFIACDDILPALLTTGGFPLYWPWPGSRDGGHCP